MKKLDVLEMEQIKGGRVSFDCALAGAGVVIMGASTIIAPPVGMTMALLGLAGYSVGIASIARSCR
jgi:hypothetical protein